MKKLIIMNAVALAMIGCGGSGSSHHSSSSAAVSSSSSVASSVAVSSSSAVSSVVVVPSSSSAVSSSVSSSSVASSSSSSVSSSNWELVWSDEFEGSAVDTTKWSFERNCTGGGNNERQCYTNRTENANITNGVLHIIARNESFNGQSKSDDEPGYDANDVSVNRNYTSARLRTKNKADWKYGRLEINAKLPQGKGIWPAIWMLPTENKYGGWPHSGEIDIMEAVNTNTTDSDGPHNNKVYGTLHFGNTWPNNVNEGAFNAAMSNVWENFHTYAIEWEEGEIRWYVDDFNYARQTKDGWFTYYWAGQEQGYKLLNTAAPFDEKFHLLLNLAVGGNWPGDPDNSTTFPQQMDVDYVRVYECKLDTVTGKGCGKLPARQALPGKHSAPQKTFSLFNNGAAQLTFDVNGTPVTTNLSPAYYDNGHAGNVVSNPAATDGVNTFWDLNFTASPGNAFLTALLSGTSTVADNGLQFLNMQSTGELKFDIYVESIDPATKLQIKLDSGWPNVSFREIDTPPVGVWTSVSVPFDKLLPNNIQNGQVDMTKIGNAFVIEPSNGTAHVKLNNIRVVCALADCQMKPVLKGVTAVLNDSFDVFVDEVDANWDIGIAKWDNDTNHVVATKVDSGDSAHGNVIDVLFKNDNNNGLAYVQASTTKDVTAFAATGYLTFDIKVLDYGTNTTGLVVKADCVDPCTSGDMVLGKIADGVWETHTIPVSQLVTGNGGKHLDLTKLNTPFVILPTWGDQKGVHLQLDNIKWIK